MLLTQHMAKCLHESFIARSVPPKEPIPTDSFRWGGTWYCPGCGVQMQEIPATNGVVCPKCGGTLGPFLYRLVERHPHRFGAKIGDEVVTEMRWSSSPPDGLA